MSGRAPGCDGQSVSGPLSDFGDCPTAAKPQTLLTGTMLGTTLKTSGSFGFIRQDNGGDDLFVMPAACAAFGGMLPPMGTPVSYEVVEDEKTGRPRADRVIPGGASTLVEKRQGTAPCSSPTTLGGGCCSHEASSRWGDDASWCSGGSWDGEGSFSDGGACASGGGDNSYGYGPCGSCGGSGFRIAGCAGYANAGTAGPSGAIASFGSSDAGYSNAKAAGSLAFHGNGSASYGNAAAMAFPSNGCAAGMLPGAMLNGRLGLMKPDQLFLGKGGCRGHPYGSFGGAPGRLGPNAKGCPPLTGTIDKVNGNFGFIKQDIGDCDMFVMPAACADFGARIPPVGTRVSYRIVTDGRTGRPRAEEVRPLPV